MPQNPLPKPPLLSRWLTPLSPLSPRLSARLLAALFFVTLFFVTLSAPLPTARSQDAPSTPADPAGLDFFEKKIRPVLVESCYQCHSAAADRKGKLQGSLSLDTREGLRRGGDSGPAVLPGQPDASLLVTSLQHDPNADFQMPPSGRLPRHVLDDFRHWVQIGAPDPRVAAAETTATSTQAIDWEAARQWWSFQKPQRHSPPDVADAGWPRGRIDQFLLAAMEAAGLSPSAAAAKQALLRRATFDLTGLPPTEDEQRAFLADVSPNAYSRLVDRLLASPRYGERWGRHWLDVSRYAEDNTNMGPHNGPFPNAWRYRDWVVQAWNEDVPYDAFLIRQLATDFLDSTGPEDLPALGYQGLAPSYHKEVALAQVVLENRYADDWEDRVDAIGRGLLGLTVACARCHDHKYDPVTAADYYALAGVFASCRQTTRPILSAAEIAKSQPARDAAAALEKDLEKDQAALKQLKPRIAELEKLAAGSSSQTPRPPDEGTAEQLTAAQREQAAAESRVKANNAELAELKQTPGFVVPVADALTEEQIRVEEIDKNRMKIVYYPNRPRDLPIFVRGDAGRLGDVTPRRFLTLFPNLGPPRFEEGSGRLELARAIAHRDNPLTARVIVNRVWMHHFGTGIVDTPSNFGATGNPPSHPELLDDLAVRFVEQGWSLKWLHREIMLSAAYQQSSQPSQSSPTPLDRWQTVDPGNRLLSHFPRRRLDAESLRDSILAVSGKLDFAVGGPSGDADDPQFFRRTIYASVSRHRLSDTLQAFDFPDPAIHCERRSETTTPLQQMFLLNAPFVQLQARALAERLRAGAAEDRVDQAHRLLFGRGAGAVELEMARRYLKPDTPERWAHYFQALLSSNEFLYVD